MVDHREEQDQRWAKVVLLACPVCGTAVLTTDLPIALVWCSTCPSSPLFERTAT